MPKCETCGSIVKKDEIQFDEARSRTCCSRCVRPGSVCGEEFQLDMRFTEKGMEVSAKTPSAGFEYASSWGDIKEALTSAKHKLFDPPQLTEGEKDDNVVEMKVVREG